MKFEIFTKGKSPDVVRLGLEMDDETVDLVVVDANGDTIALTRRQAAKIRRR